MSCEGRESQFNSMPLDDQVVGKHERHFFEISDGWEWGHLIVCGAIPVLMTQGGIRNQVQQGLGTKLVRSISPWPLYQFLPPGTYLNYITDFL